jgi:hypothetical protein
MSVAIIVYKQPNKSKSVQLSRALHGYTDHSNHGDYSYKRSGLLDQIPYVKIFNGVFLLKKKDVNKFIQLLEKYDVMYYVGNINKTSASIDFPQ